MPRRVLYSNLLNSKVYFTDPLFVVDLNLKKTVGGTTSVTNKQHGKRRDPTYITLKNNVDLRRQFIRALHLASDRSYEILRDIFMNYRTLADGTNMDYNYLDDYIIDKANIDKQCEHIEFIMLDSYNIDGDAKELYKRMKSSNPSTCIIYKTYKSNNELLKLWYTFLGVVIVNLHDERASLKAAGFNIEHDITPSNGNPLGIRYLILTL